MTHPCARLRARVRAALRATAERSAGPFVRAAFLADAERWLAVRRLAAVFACLDSDRVVVAELPSRLSALVIARARVVDGRLRVPFAARLVASFAALRVRGDAVPFLGGGSFTPARRASDNPIAIACWGDRAPCFPSRM
jgi:hypothetical protein